MAPGPPRAYERRWAVPRARPGVAAAGPRVGGRLRDPRRRRAHRLGDRVRHRAGPLRRAAAVLAAAGVGEPGLRGARRLRGHAPAARGDRRLYHRPPRHGPAGPLAGRQRPCAPAPGPDAHPAAMRLHPRRGLGPRRPRPPRQGAGHRHRPHPLTVDGALPPSAHPIERAVRPFGRTALSIGGEAATRVQLMLRARATRGPVHLPRKAFRSMRARIGSTPGGRGARRPPSALRRLLTRAISSLVICGLRRWTLLASFGSGTSFSPDPTRIVVTGTPGATRSTRFFSAARSFWTRAVGPSPTRTTPGRPSAR